MLIISLLSRVPLFGVMLNLDSGNLGTYLIFIMCESVCN